MMISHTHRFAFIHVPKTGGCSVKIALEPFADDVLGYPPNRWLERCGIRVNYFAPWPFKRFRTHTPAGILHRELPADVYAQLFTFAFVRNPWDLLVSSYHFLLHNPSHRRGRLAARLGSFARYVEYELHRGKLLQSPMLTSRHGRLLVDFVGRFETLEADFMAICRHLRVAVRLPHVNAVSHGDYRALYTPRLAATVADGFGEDIDRFGYVFDLPVVRAPHTQAA
ncbi:MAG: sulfotransferase family 2 domain-containing protein [Planctomycetia bacterium]